MLVAISVIAAGLKIWYLKETILLRLLLKSREDLELFRSSSVS